MTTSGDRVLDNPATSRFELEIDGEVAHLDYRRDHDRLVLLHTEVPHPLEGRGVGGELVTAALDDAAQKNLTVIPQCDFARAWLERHPGIACRAHIEWAADTS